MSDEFTELETELQRLRPRPPSAGTLDFLVERAPATPSRSGLVAWLWPALGAAAALGLVGAGLLVWMPVRPSATVDPTAQRFIPVSATNLLYAAGDGGIVELGDRTRARELRLRYLDTVTWRDPSGRSSVEWTVPREEIYFMPVTAD